MTLAELQQILTAADPAAVLVSSRVLDRVIQEVCGLQGLIWVIPHRDCFVVDRHILFRFVEQDDLILESHQPLPPQVILLARPTAEELSGEEISRTLLKFWRRLFHANVHLVLQDRFEQGLLTEAGIQDRIEKLGRPEFEELKAVLTQDNLLPQGSSACDKVVFIEFAAVFLELTFFASQLLPIFFPAIRDFNAVSHLLQQDLEAQTLFERTRLSKASDQENSSSESSHELHEFYWKLMRNANHASKAGDRVRSAIIRTRAARVAPAALTPGTRATAEADLKQLTKRLEEPFGFTEEQSEELLKDLKKLLDKADQGPMPVEAAFLYDLQKVCLDHEKEIYTLDLVHWVLSIGKRPIKRPLPSQRMVRIIRHLGSALQKLTICRLSDEDRKHLTYLLQFALQKAEQRLRERFRPVLIAVMEDVGLTPTNPPERTAFYKMIEEFLDRIIDSGFVTFGDLRDSISRNQLKMPDLSNPQELVRGDPLLRLDRRLATLLDGVYRPSEIYMRWLEKGTSLGFGTKLGRFITHTFIFPFSAAFVLLECLHFISKKIHGPSLDDQGSLVGWGISGLITDPSFLGSTVVLSWVLLGVFFLGCFYSEPFRLKCLRLGKSTALLVKTAIIDFPFFIITMPTLQRIFASWPVQLSYWYILKPGLLSGILWLIFPFLFNTLLSVIICFLIINVLINSHTGLLLGESLLQGLFFLVQMIRSGLLLGLYNFIVALFKKITHFVEYLLFSVDEWLRFRKGESEFSLFLRTMLSTLWFPISFILRFYWIVLIEPMVNPIKMPICLIAGKLFFPFYLPLQREATALLSPILGPVLGETIALVTVFLLPDLCGFLIWEFKENWSLYRANRPVYLQPVRIGHHGETLRGLLQPGFHSGTIPNLFDRLRRTEKSSSRLGNWRVLRSYRQSLENIKNDIKKFVTREMIALLNQSSSWALNPLKVGEVQLATKRIEVELLHERFLFQPLWITFELRSKWLTAQIRKPGWLLSLPPESFWVFLASLAYLFKAAGIDLIHEQIQNVLPKTISFFDITPTGLLVGINNSLPEFVHYDFQPINGSLIPRRISGEANLEWPLLKPNQIIFASKKLKWEQLVEAWNEKNAGNRDYQFLASHLDLFVGFTRENQPIWVGEMPNGIPSTIPESSTTNTQSKSA